MKKLLLAALLTVSATAAFAQKENPSGLYHLTDISYNGGKVMYKQLPRIYKLCTKEVTMHFNNFRMDNERSRLYFSMRNNDGKPLTYTGKKTGTKERQIYNSDKRGFTFDFFMPNFEGVCTEKYESGEMPNDNIDHQFRVALKMLKTNKFEQKNFLCGVWHRRGFSKTPISDVEVGRADWDEYRIIDDTNYFYFRNNAKSYIVGNGLKDGASLYITGYTFNPSNNTFTEGTDKITYNIYKISDKTISVTYTVNNHTVTEIWDRSGLPEEFQKIFGTNIKPTDKQPTPPID
ncbi:MAG: hypothetical protein IKQ72_08535 [Bacteroidaceae bacterium]|nr:hypothetical protein [Bacteroidaceae bacterium]